MKDSSVLSSKVGFFFIILLRETRQSVCSSICFSLTIIDLKRIARKLLSLADLAKTQALCIHESSTIIVISENDNLVFATFQIITPCFEDFNDSQKLTVVSFVSSFGRNHFTREVGQRMPSARVMSQLTQHPTNCISRRVSFNPDVSFRIEVFKHRRSSKGLM